MTRRTRFRPATLAVVLAPVLGLGVALAGCGRDGFPDRTARVTDGARTITFQVESCGRDGRTVYVLGRTPDGQVLQAVVGVRADHRTGVVASSGLTVGDRARDRGAFGAEAWTRRGQDGPPPGRITSAAVRGARIQLAGGLVPLDATGHPAAGSEPSAFTLDARCDQHDEGSGG